MEMTHVGGPVKGYKEEQAVHQNAPLAYVLELNWISSLYHLFFIFIIYYIILINGRSEIRDL